MSIAEAYLNAMALLWRVTIRVVLALSLVSGSHLACAQTQASTAKEKLVLIVQIVGNPYNDTRLSDALAQAKVDIPTMQTVKIANERDFLPLMERMSDQQLGLVVLIAPANLDIISKVPGLFPDIYFTIIDAGDVFYSSNVQNIHFNEEQGNFLLGAITAKRNSKKITIISDDSALNDKKNVQHFIEGARYASSTIEIEKVELKDIGNSSPAQLTSRLNEIYQTGTDIIFSTDRVVTNAALRAAKPERRLVVYDAIPDASMDENRLLTYMVKRYDLALLDVIRIYKHNQWRAGLITLGVDGGYVDYALTQENIEIFPNESLDAIEGIKDFISQGILPKH